MNFNKNIKNSRKTHDFEVAHGLHEQLNCTGITENAIIPKQRDKENYRPRTLIDRTLEYIDPTPNIHTLFVQFNAKFFWNVLLPVEVKWSHRMTACAGVCSFHPRNRQCVISLSAPLLKLRPRKDLVETLLHEMIHGYLFLTNNNRDRDGHGPEFCKHMNRINREAGTTITIYHDFHDEVKLYQQHWWKCNGPCQGKPPYFGTVRRAMNRAPGPSDYWWGDHQRLCNGQFIKVKEPENYKSKKSSGQKSMAPAKSQPNVLDWLSKNGRGKASPTSKPSKAPGRTTVVTSNKIVNGNKTKQKVESTFKKLGNNANNLHGWGTGGPSSSCNSNRSTPSKNCDSPCSGTSSRKFSSSGILGGSNRGYSKLLDQFLTPTKTTKQNHGSFGAVTNITTVQTDKKGILKRTSSTMIITNNDRIQNGRKKCLVCKAMISNEKANEHMNACIDSSLTVAEEVILINDSPKTNPPVVKKQRIDDQQSSIVVDEFTIDSDTVKCPVCFKDIRTADINYHLDNSCLRKDDVGQDSTANTSLLVPHSEVIVINDSISDESICSDVVTNEEVGIPIPRSPVIVKDCHKCLVCDAVLLPGTCLNEHLEECVGSVFNDEESILEEENEVEVIDKTLPDDKHPCPVCFDMIRKESMNEHLDTCLQRN